MIGATSLWWAAVLTAMAAVWTLARGAQQPLARVVDGYRGRHAREVGGLLAANFSTTSEPRVLVASLVAAVAALVVLSLSAGLAVGAVAAAAALWLPRLALERRLRQRRQRFDAQLEDALVVMSNALRTSPTVIDAVKLAREALAPPMSQELALVINDHRLGASVEEALARMSARMQSADLDMALVAISVGRAVGGNLGQMLDQLASTLREMKRLTGVIDAKTAEGKMQARTMGAMPVVLGGVIYLLDPKMIEPLFTDSLGHLLLAVVITCQFIGIYLIRRLSRLDV